VKLKNFGIALIVLLFSKAGFASHIMGGEITWSCLGGGAYQFNLVLYRDCNGLEIVDPALNIEVWGHSTVSSITCNLLSTTDLSPECTQVGGGPVELDCGAGTMGGNGPGAVQKFHYQSNPVVLAGIPPASGWAFTYDSFSRNWGLSNIATPSAYGITLSAYMFAINGNSANPCTDSSPQFAQDPYMLMCAGTDFQYNPSAFDSDNDSLVYSWGTPLDHFVSGSFNPPTNPAPVPFNGGYSATNPTPDMSFNPGNSPASMNSQSGVISFLSNNTGNFGIVQKIDSYRNGQLISTVNREIQMIVIPCPGYNNNPPVITPPFGGGTTFEATFFAGDLINFDIDITDPELLQDGTPQLVTLRPSGNYFGTGFTDANSGCDYTPCATLSTAPVIQGVQGVTTNFNWQTSCDHLLDATGIQQDEQVYYFVLNAQDDYCSVPGRTYETVKITLKNKEMLPAADLHCADVLPNGDVDLTWQPTVDVSGTSFVQYEVWSLEDGLIATLPAVGTSTYSVLGAGADLGAKHYYILTKFGCGGNNATSSDTLSTIYLTMTDLGDGRVMLNWNDMHNPINGGDNATYEIYREYPVGTWTLRGTVPYGGTNSMIDTVDVCDAFLTYEIRIQNAAGCTSTSNDPGLQLQDIINPWIPELYWVTIDTTTDFVDLSWNINPSDDTYGYIVYGLIGGFWTPIDTVYGILNTTYTYTATNSANMAETFRIAAFDSCWTSNIPPTYQTSALGPAHTTIYLQNTYDICGKTIDLTWTHYMGWPEAVKNYEVIVSIGGSPFEVIATLPSTQNTYTHSNVFYDANYQYFIRAISNFDTISFSNRSTRFTEQPSAAGFHYLASASHNLSGQVDLLLYTDGTASVQGYEIEVMGPLDSDFSLLAALTPTGSNFISYTDAAVFPERGAYQYRINLVDSCGQVGAVTNIARTVFLQVTTDHVQMINELSWSSYQGFDGSIVQYNVYRGINGVFDINPIGTTLPGVRSYVDDVSAYFDSQGQFCYRVEAVESLNSYNLAETAFSNTVCATIDPVVYIPNAFIVNGENPVFLPVVSLFDFDSYNLVLYDRWGGEIYITTDRNEGWDGRDAGGNLKPEGTYVYYLTFTDRDNKQYQFRGIVTMLIDQD
jgi:hypothetical protein